MDGKDVVRQIRKAARRPCRELVRVDFVEVASIPRRRTGGGSLVLPRISSDAIKALASSLYVVRANETFQADS
jgi:hypothetical protein